MWEVRIHTLLPENTLAKVSQRVLPAPNFNSTAAEDPEMHPRRAPRTHIPPLSSYTGTLHTHACTHTAAIAESTHRISRSRSARKAPSSTQLMWLLSSCLWKAKESAKAERGPCEGLGSPGRASLATECLSLHPLAGSARPCQALVHSQPVCHAALSLL